MAFSAVLLGVKLPVPVVLHWPVAVPATLPFRATLGWVLQVTTSGPASASRPPPKVTSSWSLTAPQGSMPVVVTESSTEPARLSAALG